jgi:CBS domain-containing protein
LVNADGTFIFVPTAGFGGTASFQFQATDNIGCTSNVATATITVGPLANPQTVSTCENTPLSGTLTADVSGGVAPLTFNQVGSAVNGVAVVNANGTYTFTPTTNFIGTGSFQYQVTDANECTSTATITVNILQCCVGFVASPATFTTCQNTPFNGTLVGLVTGGTPPYTYSAVGTAVGGTVVVNPAGTFTFTPTTSFTGNASFQYMAVDSTSCSATATITIVVEAVTANPTTLNTCINTPINGSLVSLVSGGTAPYTFTQVGAGVNGVAVVNANGTFTFTPTTGFTGTASFQYRATDVNGCSGTATVTINVRQVTVTATSFNSCLNTATSGNLTGLVTGGTPPYTFAQVGTAVNGVAVVNANGTFTFTPTTGFAGAGSFQYHVTDSVGCVSNTATVTINVGPLANSETITACFNTTLTGSLVPYVTGGIAPLTFAQVGTAVNGVAVVSANGAFTFTPTASFIGTGSFGYRVTDASACTSTGTITITVGQCCTPSNEPYIQYYDSIYPPSPI